MATVRLFKTNDVGDPGFEITPDEIAERFWASEDARDWLAPPLTGWPLERLALNWVPTNLGQWENSSDWDPIFDAIHAAMPRPS